MEQRNFFAPESNQVLMTTLARGTPLPRIIAVQPTDRVCLHLWVENGWRYGQLVLGQHPRATQCDGVRDDQGEWIQGLAITRVWRVDRSRGPWLILMRYHIDQAVRRAHETGLPVEVNLSDLELQSWTERKDEEILKTARAWHLLR